MNFLISKTETLLFGKNNSRLISNSLLLIRMWFFLSPLFMEMMKSFRSFPLFGSVESKLFSQCTTLMFSLHTIMFSYLPSYHLQLVLSDFKCFSLIPAINTIVKHVQGFINNNKGCSIIWTRAEKRFFQSLWRRVFIRSE